MPNNIVHFAINADDCLRAKQFYTDVFGWTFEPWGPPDFWRIFTSPDGIHGALQKRRDPVTGSGMTGYECSISVEDIEVSATDIGDFDNSQQTIGPHDDTLVSIGAERDRLAMTKVDHHLVADLTPDDVVERAVIEHVAVLEDLDEG